jgi:hypothetical protein
MKNSMTTLALAAMTSGAFGASGIYDGYVFTTTDGTSPDSFYGLGFGPAFAGADLGTFDLDVGDTL